MNVSNHPYPPKINRDINVMIYPHLGTVIICNFRVQINRRNILRKELAELLYPIISSIFWYQQQTDVTVIIKRTIEMFSGIRTSGRGTRPITQYQSIPLSLLYLERTTSMYYSLSVLHRTWNCHIHWFWYSLSNVCVHSWYRAIFFEHSSRKSAICEQNAK